jgi:hypothetical protein
MNHLLLSTLLAISTASCIASDTAQLPAADMARIDELDWTIKKKIVFPIKVGDLVSALGGEKQLVVSSFGSEIGVRRWILFSATRPNAAGGVYQIEVTTSANSSGHLFEHQALGARIIYQSETHHIFELVSPYEKEVKKADPDGQRTTRGL